MPLFPVTDPSRTGDIRMRRRRAVLLLAGIGLGLAAINRDGGTKPAPGGADVAAGPARGLFARGDRLSRTELDGILGAIPLIGRLPWHVQGAPLAFPGADWPRRVLPAAPATIALGCARSITLLPMAEPARAVLSVRPGQERALAAARVEGGTLAGCVPGDVSLQLPLHVPFTLVQAGGAEVRGGRFASPVTLVLSGDGTVSLDGSGALDVRQSGSGDVFVGEIDGPVTARLGGSGDLRINNGTVPHLDAALSASGSLALGRARIGGVSATLTASGDLTAGRIEGPVRARSGGSGDITFDTVVSDQALLSGGGSGDIVVKGGRIGMLTAHRSGSGDLTVDATVGSGTVEHHGSGDVSIPEMSTSADAPDGAPDSAANTRPD